MGALMLLFALTLPQAPLPVPGTSVIAGTVVFSDGSPAAGITLTAITAVETTPTQGSPVARRTTVSSTGTYRFTGLPSGRYYIRTAPPLPAVYYPGVETEGNAKAVSLEASATVEDLQFTLPLQASGVRVAGRTVLPARYPLAPPQAARLSLGTSPIPNQFASLAPDGTFEFKHVMPGSYTVTVEPGPGTPPVPVTVADKDATELEVRVAPVVALQGTLAFAGNVSMQTPAVLQISGIGSSANASPFRTTLTLAERTFQTWIPEGSYTLLFSRLPAGTYVRTISSGDRDLITTPLNVSASAASVAVNVVIGASAGVRVRGRVKAGSGASSEYPRKVLLSALAFNSTAEGPVEDDGSFDLPAVLPGVYVGRVSLDSTISSPSFSLTLGETIAEPLEIEVPEPREIFGRIAVDGNGPPPKFSFVLVRGAGDDVLSTTASGIPSISLPDIQGLVRSGKGEVQVLQIDVNALPDGSFHARIPDGEYRVAVVAGTGQINGAGVPPAYFVRSFTSGGADLLKNSWLVSSSSPVELQIGLGVTLPNPWVKIAGRVVGLDPGQGSIRVALEGSITSTLETFVDSAGKFEFPTVLRGSSYTARLLPLRDAASSPRVNVVDKDVVDVEIVAPPEQEVSIQTAVEGNGPVPAFALTLTGTNGSMTIVIRPEADGRDRVKLPSDDRRLRPVLPLGYSVKSLAYGSADLLKEPLKLIKDSVSEIRVVLTLDPALTMGSVRGRVTGLDPEVRSTRLVLNSAASYMTFETSLSADGSFNFPKIPMGAYVPSLEGDTNASWLSPSMIQVSGTDLAGIEIAAARRGARRPQGAGENLPTGVLVSDMGGGSRESANESAALANLRTINTALVTYLSSTRGQFGGLTDLVNAGLLDASFTNGPKAGFHFSVLSTGKDYAAAAVPASGDGGRFGYFSTPDGVLRYSPIGAIAPARMGGKPVQ